MAASAGEALWALLRTASSGASAWTCSSWRSSLPACCWRRARRCGSGRPFAHGVTASPPPAGRRAARPRLSGARRRGRRRRRSWSSPTRRPRATPPTSMRTDGVAGGPVRPGREHAHRRTSSTGARGAGDLRRRRAAADVAEPAHAEPADDADEGEQLSLAEAAAGEPGEADAGARLPRGREAPVDAARAPRCCSASARASGESPEAIQRGLAAPGRDARPLRHHRAGHRHRLGAARDALRAAAGAGHQGEPRRLAQGRPRLRAGGHRRARAGADPRQDRRRRRGAQHRRPTTSRSATSTGSSRRTPRRWPSGSARTSPARPSSPTSSRWSTCSSPAPPARARAAASTPSSARSCCAPRRTRCA